MEYLQPKSRPAAAPYERIDQEATRAALFAERALQRSLLRRCEAVLQDLAIEERAAGNADAVVEQLLRDISIVCDVRYEE